MDVLDELAVQNTLLCETHLRSKGAVWDPFARVARSGFFQHTVDLLEGKSLGLRNEEVGVYEAATAERALFNRRQVSNLVSGLQLMFGTYPDEEHLSAQVTLIFVDHIRGDDSDDAVPEPVRCGGQSDTTGPDGKWKDFSYHNPCTRAPGRREEEDIYTNECNHSLDCIGIIWSDSTDDGDNELANNHSERTPDQDWTSSNSLNHPEG